MIQSRFVYYKTKAAYDLAKPHFQYNTVYQCEEGNITWFHGRELLEGGLVEHLSESEWEALQEDPAEFAQWVTEHRGWDIDIYEDEAIDIDEGGMEYDAETHTLTFPTDYYSEGVLTLPTSSFDKTTGTLTI